MSSGSVVGSSKVLTSPLKTTTPSLAFVGRLAAKARAATIASAIGRPAMLLDASITRIVADEPGWSPAGTTVRSLTASPFSWTLTSLVLSFRGVGSVRM